MEESVSRAQGRCVCGFLQGKREPVEESAELGGDAFVDFYKDNGSRWRNLQELRGDAFADIYKEIKKVF